MEPIKLEFIVKGDIEKELARVQLAIKGVGDESYTSFKRLLGSSNEAFNGLSRTAQGQAVILQRVIQELRQNEAAQEALYDKLEKGTVSSNEYAVAQARLSVQQAELKQQASELNRVIEREIQLNSKVSDSLEQRKAYVASLKAEYAKLSDEERDNEKVGGKLIERIKVINQEIEQINNRLKQEKNAVTLVSGSLQEKTTILGRLREEYSRLNKEERENEKIGGQLLNRIRELDRELKNINGGLKETKSSSSDLTGALEQIPGPIGAGVSQFRQLLSVGKTFMSSGIGMFVAGLASTFFLLKTAIEGSEEGTTRLNGKMEYFKSIFDSQKKMLTQGAAAFYNLFTGNTQAMKQNLAQLVLLQFGQTAYADAAEKAAIKQVEINKLDERNKSLILAKNAAIEENRTKLMDVNLTFEERKKIGQEILKQEKEIANLKLDPLAQNYENFKSGKDGFGYGMAKYQFPEQTKLAEKYFETLAKGGELTLTQQEDMMNAVHDITNGLDAAWDDKQKSKFRSYFTDALTVTKEYYSKSREVSTNLSNIIKQQANETARANKKTSLEKLQEEVKTYKEQYDILYAYERNMGKEAADLAFKDLKAKGGDFIAYLSKKINELQAKPNRTKDDNTNLGYLQKTRQEVAPKFDASAFRNSIDEKKKLYKEDIEGYLAYLERLRRLMNRDTSTAGTQKRITLDLEITDVKEEQRKNLNDLLKNYRSFTVKMSSLEKDYQRDMTRLGKAAKEATTDYDKKRYQDAIDARTDAYQVEMATMLAENSDFTQVLFGDLEKISRSALKKSIAEARKFIAEWKKTAGTLTPEMKALLDKIEQGITGAEKQEGSKLAETLQNVSSLLNECSNMAGEFSDSLAKSIDNASKIATAMGQLVSKDYFGAATSIMSAVTSVVASIAQSNREAIEIAKKAEGSYWDAVNWKIERQIQLMKELEGISSDQINQSVQAQINELLDTIHNADLDVAINKGHGIAGFVDLVENSIESAKKKGDKFAINFLEGFSNSFGDKNKSDFDGHMNLRFYDVLKDLSQDEIISLQGIPEIWKILPESIQNYIKQLSDAVDKQKELAEANKETVTNTTKSALTDSIVQGFLNGKRSAADFADDFRDLMRNAMMQAVKVKYLEKPLQEWYERFAASSENGLTADKIEELRNEYDKIINNASKEAEALEKITGVTLAQDANREAVAKGIQSVSQDSFDEFMGSVNALTYITSGIDKNISSIHSLLYDAAEKWVKIEENTRHCVRLENIEKDMKEVRNGIVKMVNSGVLIRKS